MKNIRKIYFFVSILLLIYLMQILFGNAEAQNTTQPPLEKYMYEKYDIKKFNGYTVALVLKQPVPNSRIVTTPSFDAGHAYLRIAKHGEHAWVSYVGLKANEISDSGDISGDVLWQGDATHSWSVAKVFEISETDAFSLLKYCKDWSKKNTYNLATNNCATFVVNALASVKIDSLKTGISPHKWTIPEDMSDVAIYIKDYLKNTPEFVGYSPADATEDMKKSPGAILP